MDYKKRDQMIVDMINEEKTYQEVADFFGISRQRVHQILVENNAIRTPVDRTHKRYVWIDIDKIAKSRLNGLKDKEKELEKEKTILTDWYENRLSVQQILDKWQVRRDEFLRINKRWRQYAQRRGLDK